MKMTGNGPSGNQQVGGPITSNNIQCKSGCKVLVERIEDGASKLVLAQNARRVATKIV